MYKVILIPLRVFIVGCLCLLYLLPAKLSSQLSSSEFIKMSITERLNYVMNMPYVEMETLKLAQFFHQFIPIAKEIMDYRTLFYLKYQLNKSREALKIGNRELMKILNDWLETLKNCIKLNEIKGCEGLC